MDEQFDKYRQPIRRIFLEENKTLNELMLKMKNEHGFVATKSQYETRLKRWGFQKNLTHEDWNHLAYYMRQRTHSGKESEVIASGRRLPRKKVEKAIKRYSYHTTLESLQPVIPSHHNDDLRAWLRTPSPKPLDFLYPAMLPWFSFTNENKQYLELIETSPLFTNLITTFTMEIVLDAMPKLSISTSHETSMTATYQKLSNITKYLRVVIPVGPACEHLRRAESLCRFGGCDDALMALETLLFLVSNNHIPWTKRADEMILEIFENLSLSRPADLRHLLTSTQLTAQSLIDGIYGAAVRLHNTYWVGHLLQAGISIQHLVMTRYLGSMFPAMSALGIALSCGADDFVEWILTQIEDTTLCDFVDEMCLLHAVQGAAYNLKGGLENVRQILDRLRVTGSAPIGRSMIISLQDATERGFVEISKIILDHIHDSADENWNQKTRSHLLIGAILNRYDRLTHIIIDNISRTTDSSASEYLPFGSMALWACAQTKSVDICTRLLDLGFDPNPTSEILPSPLCQAAFLGDITLIRLLLRYGAHINQQHRKLRYWRPGTIHNWLRQKDWLYIEKSDTALGAALFNGQVEAANFLMSNGARPRAAECIHAIRNGFRGCLESLDLITLNDTHHLTEGTILEAAILASEIDLVYDIIDNGKGMFDPGALCAAVYMSIKTNDIKLIQTILHQRVHHSADDDDLEGTACIIALMCSKWDVVDLLFRGPCQLRPHSAYWPREPGEGMHLLERPSCLCWWRYKKSRWSYTTVLAAAVQESDQRAVNFLLQLGYVPSPEAFISAARLGNLPILKTLLASIESVNNRTQLLDGSLAGALEAGHLDTFRLLHDSGADIQARAPGKYGSTALQIAAIKGYMGVAMELIQLVADLDAPGAFRYGRTALEGAAENGRLDMVSLLLQKGASTLGPGQRQYIRAVLLATREGHHAVAKFLRQYHTWSDVENLFDKNFSEDEWSQVDEMERYESSESEGSIEDTHEDDGENEDHMSISDCPFERSCSHITDQHGSDGLRDADLYNDTANFQTVEYSGRGTMIEGSSVNDDWLDQFIVFPDDEVEIE